MSVMEGGMVARRWTGRFRWGAALLAGLVLAVGLLTPGHDAWADAPQPLRLTAAAAGGSLSGHFSQLIDDQRALSFADVLRADAEGRFVAGGNFRGVGQTTAIHWYRFDLVREPGADADWILEMGEPYIDHLDLYVPLIPGDSPIEPEAYRVIRMGDFVPYSQRPMQTRLHSTPLALPEGRLTTVYLRIDSVSAISLSAALWTPKAFIARQTTALVFYGMFFGVLAILVVVYLAVGTLLRDAVLLTYTAHIAWMLVFFLFATGLAAAFLPDAPGWLMNLTVGGLVLLGTAIAMLLWGRLLNLRRNFPRLHHVYRGVAVLAVLAIPSSLTSWFSVVSPLISTLGASMALVSLILIVVLMRRGSHDGSLRFYLACALTSIIGLILSQLKLRGVLPSDLSIEPYPIAALLGVLILGAGLALRIRRLQTERVRAEESVAFATKRAEEQRIFVAMLSHEFRTPLASIDGAAQMIALDVQDAPPLLKRLDRIRNTTRKLADLVDVFLSSQALDHGALALQPEWMTVGRLLDAAMDGVTTADAETRVVVTTRVADRELRGDLQFLCVAITNVIQNALRYSPPDAPVVVTAEDAPGGIVIRVADQGRGMSGEEVARIGAIYFRASSSRGTKGSGVGLYMTQKIVAAHGGRLSVESRDGVGSIFTIHLPDPAAAPTPAAAD
jgi:two-component system, sensor histidine kinase LadS